MQGLSPDSLDAWLAARGERPELECVERAKLLVQGWIGHQRALNIVSVGMLESQVEASLAASRALEESRARGPFVDVGSGGGFPGLWVAAMWKGTGWLVEPRARRADFLELMLARMGRQDWSVVRARWEGRKWDAVGNGQEAACERLSSVLDADGVADAAEPPGAVVSARAVWEPGIWWPEGAHMVGGTGGVMMHVRAEEGVPEDASVCAEVVREDWCVRILRRRPGSIVGP